MRISSIAGSLLSVGGLGSSIVVDEVLVLEDVLVLDDVVEEEVLDPLVDVDDSGADGDCDASPMTIKTSASSAMSTKGTRLAPLTWPGPAVFT